MCLAGNAWLMRNRNKRLDLAKQRKRKSERVKTLDTPRLLHHHDRSVHGLALVPPLLVSSSYSAVSANAQDEDLLRLWHCTDLKPLRYLPPRQTTTHPALSAHAVALAPNCRNLAVGEGQALLLYSVPSWRLIAQIAHCSQVCTLVYCCLPR